MVEPNKPALGPRPQRSYLRFDSQTLLSKEVEAMFSDIAPKYDRANDVLSFGVARGWRRKAVKRSGIGPGGRVLDVATGTGDLAFAFKHVVGDSGSVTGLDFSEGMLKVAEAKRDRRGLDVEFLQGDALDLPFDAGSFDVASIAFGIRNVDDPGRGVAQMARVVGSGGRVVVLEFGQPRGVLGVSYRWYSRYIMPRIGGLLTGNRAAYEYLPRTAAEFPAGDAFVALMRDAADFEQIEAWPLTGGVAWLYVGTVA